MDDKHKINSAEFFEKLSKKILKKIENYYGKKIAGKNFALQNFGK